MRRAFLQVRSAKVEDEVVGVWGERPAAGRLDERLIKEADVFSR